MAVEHGVEDKMEHTHINKHGRFHPPDDSLALFQGDYLGSQEFSNWVSRYSIYNMVWEDKSHIE